MTEGMIRIFESIEIDILDPSFYAAAGPAREALGVSLRAGG
jgi:hypothetical protein